MTRCKGPSDAAHGRLELGHGWNSELVESVHAALEEAREAAGLLVGHRERAADDERSELRSVATRAGQRQRAKRTETGGSQRIWKVLGEVGDERERESARTGNVTRHFEAPSGSGAAAHSGGRSKLSSTRLCLNPAREQATAKPRQVHPRPVPSIWTSAPKSHGKVTGSVPDQPPHAYSGSSSLFAE